jgi:hypothetical protein
LTSIILQAIFYEIDIWHKDGENSRRLAKIMRQTRQPRSKKVSETSLPGENPQKFLFLKQNLLVEAMIAQAFMSPSSVKMSQM